MIFEIVSSLSREKSDPFYASILIRVGNLFEIYDITHLGLKVAWSIEYEY